MSSGSDEKKALPKKRASQITAVRLPIEVVLKIDSLVGRGNRSGFIAAAIEKELKRQARLAHIEKGEGFIPDDLDASNFVNKLRSWDGKADWVAPRGFLLDTDFLIDLNRGRRNVLRQRAEKLLLSINDGDLYISSVTVTEFLTGVPKDKQEMVKKILKEQYFYLAPAFEDAVLAGKLRREWLKHGYTLALSDVTNAALAISRNLGLVTRNAAHYPFPELGIIGW